MHFLTNYGIYIYDFPVDLTDAEGINKFGITNSFKEDSKRLIKLDYDYFNGEVASNKYGSAFLFSRKTVGDNYEVFLVAESFYSAPNSRIFKMINITQNEQCTNLNEDLYYESSPEDQIAVSFICNQYLRIYRVCMRPHVNIYLGDFY